MFIINIEPTPFVVFLHMYMIKSSNKSFYLAITEGTEPLLLITKYHIWLGGIFQFHMINVSLGILISLVNASLIKRDTVNLLTLPSVIYKIILLKTIRIAYTSTLKMIRNRCLCSWLAKLCRTAGLPSISLNSHGQQLRAMVSRPTCTSIITRSKLYSKNLYMKESQYCGPQLDIYYLDDV